jgi:hypothetical protein
MPVKTKRGITRLTSLQVANKFMEQTVAGFEFIDSQAVVVGATSALANTTTTASVSIANCALTDIFIVQPSVALTAGLIVVNAYVSAASTGSTSPEDTAGEVAGTLKIVFANLTGSPIAAAGTYNYLQFSQTAGAV